MDSERYNSEGYPDPTAYMALRNIERENTPLSLSAIVEKELKEMIAAAERERFWRKVKSCK